ncbi:MAG: hypothetical protein NXY57DRAFT_1047216 [Lentinula lateritia]|uniref:Uncharacterized protein n=1 Tax=Lentinula lateritia TaxID=40482 RepID=A0ABQ8VTG7_9AGAR|nr:uncharacterized protein C8R40DRAFT_1158179 [Lentinula edodes]KAJ3861293.1 hypothetical protein EV359DRAFT_74781 [Lentinula novae-zelandiae]KAJ3934637.1 MAG: hypothetical protein NXY57DRAFT_1047216 [Lentinula lateritia]KAH7880734.1 hypothetical protein C8R40DRAFT_1158179 [Lentinula edodes]KAJ3879918.1 hypothetical protein F5051DRAFT_459674 [Lentinula edodes]KAJ3890134.1 hypothetical protein GG344DRAFT_89065 [Lentinula edodes]
MDFVQGLDPSKLALFGAGFSFFLSGFTAPPYNLPIFLFGIYAQENADSAFLSLQTFTGLLGASVFYDIIWMFRNEQGGFVKFLTIILLLVKIPTFLAFGLAARQRGAQFAGLGIRGNDINGPTVWAMPGGFSSTAGYQNVDDEISPQPATRTVAPPSGPTAPVQAAPGAYQTV